MIISKHFMRLIIVFLLLSKTIQAQYIFEKKPGENVERFIRRSFPELEKKLLDKIIVRSWGDTTLGDKILFFFHDNDFNGRNDVKAIVLQPVFERTYVKLTFNYSFGIGQNLTNAGVLDH
jgi:hypothetical protein